jgi:hypothetical protein
MKINIDFKEKYFASRMIHPSRFVNVEYMHSASMKDVSHLPARWSATTGDLLLVRISKAPISQ